MAMLFAMSGMAQSTDPMVVSTESGLVKGFDHEGSMGFLGIPYAKVVLREGQGKILAYYLLSVS